VFPSQICAAVNENEGDAIQAYGGNKSAGLRVRKALREIELHCIDMRNALFDKPPRKNAAGRKKEGEAAVDGANPALDAQSDDDEDFDREMDSDVECDRRPSSPTPPSEPGNEVHEYQFLKPDLNAGVSAHGFKDSASPWPPGLQNLKPGMRFDLGGERPQIPMQTTPPVHSHVHHVHHVSHVPHIHHVPSSIHVPPHVPMATAHVQYEEPTWPPSVVFLNRDRL